MPMLAEELKDRPVVAINEGARLGEIQDVLLDESYLQLGALVISGGGLFGGRKQAIPYSAVHGIGPDAVMISGRDAVRPVEDGGALAAMHRLGDLKQAVLSEGGVHLGRVAGVEFDPQNGAVTGLRFDPERQAGGDGAVKNVVPRADIVSMSAKIAVVRQVATEAPPASKPEALAADEESSH